MPPSGLPPKGLGTDLAEHDDVALGHDVAAAHERELTAPSWARWWTLPMLITLLFLVLQPLLGSSWALFPDSYRYAKQAEKIMGVPAGQAHLDALQAFCSTRAANETWRGTWVTREQSPSEHQARTDACLKTYAGKGDVTTLDPRYQSIFTTRPGYPLLAAPFINVFGIAHGLRILGFVMATIGGLLCYTVLRLAGLRAIAAAGGQAMYLWSPIGWWSLQGLGEGLVNICALGAVAGVLLARRRSPRAGLAVLIVSWVALGMVRYSSLMLVAAAMTAACTVLAIWGGGRWRQITWVAAAISAAAVVTTAVAMRLLDLPGAGTTLQDTFTHHFSEPLVDDPWHLLMWHDSHFWLGWVGSPSTSWALLALTFAGLALLAVFNRTLLWPALALLGVGVAQITAHPLPHEATRLGELMWIPAVFGLAVLVERLTRRLRVSTRFYLAPHGPGAAVESSSPGPLGSSPTHAPTRPRRQGERRQPERT